MLPKYKVTITHSGSDVDYESEKFLTVNVKRRVCNYDVATLTVADDTHAFLISEASVFDPVKIYLKADYGDAYTLVFGGAIRQINPIVTLDGKIIVLNCKGYGAALEETHCNRDYGTESSNPSYPQPWNIATNVITEFVNKSFDDTDTGHSLNSSYITDTFATDVKYINNPYRANIEVIDGLCQLTSAFGAGSSAGAHWIVDAEARFLLAKIGDHAAGAGSPEAYWPDWWNTDQAGSTLIQGSDFEEFNVLTKTEEYANHIVLITDFRRPAFDYWTQNHADLWGSSGLTSLTAVTTVGGKAPPVGTHCIKILGDNVNDGEAWYPAAKDAAWDITRWGSAKTIPHLNFYMQKDGNVSEADTYISLFKSSDMLTDSFTAKFSLWTEPDNEWVHKSLPVGSHWSSSEESKQFRWTKNGSVDWDEINGVAFLCNAGSPFNGTLYLNDMHYDGKIIRSAIDTDAVTAYKENQRVIIARTSMDDSCIADDDTGFAGRIAYAELLRRTANPTTVTFTTAMGKPTMMAGQKTHLHLCKKTDSSFAYNTDFRILTVEHNLDFTGGFTTTVTATNDLLNSFPISVPDAYAMWQENMFLFSQEAKNVRAGGEVDLLIPRLTKTY